MNAATRRYPVSHFHVALCGVVGVADRLKAQKWVQAWLEATLQKVVQHAEADSTVEELAKKEAALLAVCPSSRSARLHTLTLGGGEGGSVPYSCILGARGVCVSIKGYWVPYPYIVGTICEKT